MRHPSGLLLARVTVSKEWGSAFVGWPALERIAHKLLLDGSSRVGEIPLRIIECFDNLPAAACRARDSSLQLRVPLYSRNFVDHWSLGRLLVDVEPVELVELFDHCRGRWYDFRV